MMIIGLKYCGGCNPDFDRVALFELISRRLENRVSFMTDNLHDADAILVIHGCRTACTNVVAFEGLTLYQIVQPADAWQFINEMENL